MTVDVVFPSPWEKLQRAKFHVGELTEAVRKRVEQLEGQGERMFTFEQDYRPRLHCIVFTIESAQPADVRWSVMIGDAFHNFRSALDHIAWQLVVAGKRPPHTLTEGQQRRVAYPIYTDREDFNDWLPKRLPGVDKRKIAVIRGLQPYRWGKRHAKQDSLAVLEKFSNLDKHRALQAGFFRPFNRVFTDGPGGATDFLPDRRTSPKAVLWYPGTEVLRVYGRRLGPHPHLDMKIVSSADVALEGGYWLGDLFEQTRRTIVQVMARLEPLM